MRAQSCHRSNSPTRKRRRAFARAQLLLLGRALDGLPGGRPVLRAAAHRLNTLSPMNSLPDELLFQVFHLLDEDPLYSTPVRLCVRWRIVALNEPRLWSRITISRRSRFPAISTFLGRSCDTPLQVTISGAPLYRDASDGSITPTSDIVRICDKLILHVGRLSELDISAHSYEDLKQLLGLIITCPAPLLRKLSVNVTELQRGRLYAPRLAPPRNPLLDGNLQWYCHLEVLSFKSYVDGHTLLSLLHLTPRLQFLEVAGLSSSGLQTCADPSLLQRIPLREFVCKGPHGTVLLEHVGPARRIPRIAVGWVSAGNHDLAHLLEGMQSISSLRANFRDGVVDFALGDSRGSRRQFQVSGGDVSPILKESFACGAMFQDIQRFTIPAWKWTAVLDMLQTSVLVGLQTVVFELQPPAMEQVSDDELRPIPVLSRRQAREPVYLPFDGPHSEANPSRQLGAPNLQEVALVLTARVQRHLRAVIDPATALRYIQRLICNPVELPTLRLVGIELSSAPSFDAEHRSLRRHVTRIMETEPLHSGSSWAGVPKHTFVPF